MKQVSSFSTIIKRLEVHYGEPHPPKTSDPLGLIMYETIAYLVADEKRDAAFAVLQERVGLKPTEILAASTEELANIRSYWPYGTYCNQSVDDNR